MNCEICGKEAKNAAGLAAHVRSHAKPEEPKKEPETAKECLTVDSYGKFCLKECGGHWKVTDNDGKPLTKELNENDARKLFDRWTSPRQ